MNIESEQRGRFSWHLSVDVNKYDPAVLFHQGTEHLGCALEVIERGHNSPPASECQILFTVEAAMPSSEHVFF